MRPVRRIFVHCSASEWGDLQEVTRWHKQRGWDTIGYHALITNQFPTYRHYKDCTGVAAFDGKVWVGREDAEIGSHVKGANRDSLGVCLVGNEAFSSKQVDALVAWCVRKCREYALSASAVRGHCEWWSDQGLPPGKSCPNLPMADIRQRIAAHILAETVV
jgi:hypothetical protein